MLVRYDNMIKSKGHFQTKFFTAFLQELGGGAHAVGSLSLQNVSRILFVRVT